MFNFCYPLPLSLEDKCIKNSSSSLKGGDCFIFYHFSLSSIFTSYLSQSFEKYVAAWKNPFLQLAISFPFHSFRLQPLELWEASVAFQLLYQTNSNSSNKLCAGFTFNIHGKSFLKNGVWNTLLAFPAHFWYVSTKILFMDSFPLLTPPFPFPLKKSWRTCKLN